MLTSRSAIICAAVATVIALICHPRVVYGDGASFTLVSFDDLFFAGQWTAFALAILSLVISIVVMRSGNAGSQTITAVYATALIVWLVATGIPHPENKSQWSSRELGIKAFARGIARREKANAKPAVLDASPLAGSWTATDGSVFTFRPDAVTWRGPATNVEYSRTACGASFNLEYVQRERDVLQDNGLTWSSHAAALHEKTPPDAKFPVAYLACGQDRFMFIRATSTELWRWTNSMNANDLKGTSFVLRGPG